MKNNWRRNKNKFKKGIKKWHKSTKGKRFHKALGRFNALREGISSYYYNDAQKVDLSIGQVNDALLSLSSIETHLFIELQYYEPDSVAMNEFLEIVYNFMQDISGIKIELLDTYISGYIDTSTYDDILDIIQFFQDPKMYLYAKRDINGLSNEANDSNLIEQLKILENMDFLEDSQKVYSEIDSLFN